MSTSLRERRRRQTARDIQWAAVAVTLRCGYEHTTTEAIAAEAGISTRTFFNYYGNKQAAILGEAATLNTTGSDWFSKSDAPIIDDLVRLMARALKEDDLNRQMLQNIIKVIECNPILLDLFRKRMDETSHNVTKLLEARLGKEFAIEARLLAELSTYALTYAIQVWAVDETMSIDEVPKLLGRKLQNVCNLMCEPISFDT